MRCQHPFGQGDVVHGTVCGACNRPIVRGPNGQALEKGDDHVAVEQACFWLMQAQNQLRAMQAVIRQVPGSRLDTLRATLANTNDWLAKATAEAYRLRGEK